MDEPWARTCPQWYRTSPFVQSILEELPDYEAGRLGRSQDLDAPLLTYLRVAAMERKAWEAHQL